MKNLCEKFAIVLLFMMVSMPASAQFNLKKAIGGAAKATQAVTLTDKQMSAYVKE